MDEFKVQISELIRYLKSRKMCSQSIHSHQECYETLIEYLDAQKTGYSEMVGTAWLYSVRQQLSHNKFDIWVWYIKQLNEFLKRGAISDFIYYLNRSCYERLPINIRNELDCYLESCSGIYTRRTYKETKIRCSSIIISILAGNPDITSVSDITYADVEALADNDLSSKRYGRNTYMNYAHRMFEYFASHGMCKKGLGIITTTHYALQAGSLMDVFDTEKEPLPSTDNNDSGLDAKQYDSLVQDFLKLLDDKGYSYTVKKYSKRALTALYLFLDKYDLRYTPLLAWKWFDSIKETCGESWKSWRRMIKLFEEYYHDHDIKDGTRYLYTSERLKKYPVWCQEAVKGFQDRLRREFKNPHTVYKVSFPCMRFCDFVLSRGLTSFSQLIPDMIIEFCLQDEHSTVKGRSSYARAVKKFLYYLEDTGIIEGDQLHHAVFTGKSPEIGIVDILSEEDEKKIYDFRKKAVSPEELRKSAMVLLGLRTGLRASDITNLKLQDIDWKEHTISIVQQKTGRPLTIPWPNDVGNAVYRYIKYGRPRSDSGYLFIRHTAPYCKLSTKICNNALYAMLPDRKSVKHKGFHVTRRTFATNMLRSQSGIDAVMNALGHTDNTTVMKYLSFDSEGMGKCPLSLSECGIGSGGLYGDI